MLSYGLLYRIHEGQSLCYVLLSGKAERSFLKSEVAF